MNRLTLCLLTSTLILTIGTACKHTETQSTPELNPPFADIHLHYNWDQAEIIDPASVIQRLRDQNVVLAVVSSTPSDFALKLDEAGGDLILPIFSPYITPAHKQSWFLDHAVVEQARAGLEAKRYFGIGELHLWGGLPPRYDNQVLLGLLDLAKQHDVPFLLHTEASDPEFIIPVCTQHRDVRILWAHAGGILKPDAVEAAMSRCPKLWVELSARDPWRYNTLVDNNGKLPADWKNLIVRYSDRFMTGSDPVWAVTKTQRWDSADEGWDHLAELIAFHRAWLKELPKEVEEKVRLTNALGFFNTRKPSTAP